jgi:hypothetical protein
VKLVGRYRAMSHQEILFVPGHTHEANETKECSDCTRAVQLYHFNHDQNTSDDHDTICKFCRRRAQQSAEQQNTTTWDELYKRRYY